MRSWTQFALFFSVMTALIAGLHYYLYVRLARAPGLESWQRTGAWIFALGALLLPAGMLLSRVLSRPASTFAATVSYTWMGLFALMLFMTLGSELIRGACWVGPIRTRETSDRRAVGPSDR